MNMTQEPNQRPVVGCIYRDKLDSSFVVLSIDKDKVLLAYASGTVTSIEAKNWPQLHPQIAVY